MRHMRIYLACTVRGDRGAVAALRELADALERAGHHVLTRHLLDDNVDTAEALLSERQVYERDVEWLTGADLVIADASGSSYGVGFEVGYVLGRSDASGQRVVLVYDRSRLDRVSRLITGNCHPNCVTYAYDGADDLVGFVTGLVTPVRSGDAR